ncbi:hypothetical protein L1987_06396 [Smallanthus sonchifolius]|uniref:Uncharacterized protein n=1 Tax=Smallanthus sonchifolius TaxID=185202 RepID=A0ACB9JY23_9ASTR|nr:hypothetical protein L1987_06396 [Smallanthus sonchifolius]
MVARKKRKKTSGSPPKSTSKGKSIEDDDTDYNPDKDLNPYVTKVKKHKVSRTKPSRVLVQEGVNILNTIFSQATTTTQVPVSVSTPPCPKSTSTQDTQRLPDDLISTPPVGYSNSPAMTILVSTSVIPIHQLHNKDARVVSLKNLVGDVVKVNDAHQAIIITHRSQLLVKQLQIESYDGPEGAHGGDEQPIASSMPSVSLAGDYTVQGESEDDWESDAEDVEIEFEQDDEAVKYATHECVEFDTSFIDQINQLAQEDREEGEITEEFEKDSDSI